MSENVVPVKPLKLVRDFFGFGLSEMKREWVPMPEADKAQIIKGLSDGSLTY